MKLTKKQTRAIDFLEDNTTTETLYGGAAGGGKSYLGCYWQIKKRLQYPGTRGLIGRSVLKSLKETTLNSFFQVCKEQGLKADTHFVYNATASTINFPNGSQILLKDLCTYPSDPNFDSLGSLEITDAFIDECNQVSKKAKDIVKSRIRYKLDEFDIIPKLFLTCNPAKNWVYSDFYKPHKENILEPGKQFIQALVTDNPNISRHYIANLATLDYASRERLLYGNWDYDNTADKLFLFDKLNDIFTNEFVPTGRNYITADIARMGSDKAVIIVWKGWKAIDITVFDTSATTTLENKIREYANLYKVPMSNVVVDEDGVGGGVKDHLQCQGFVNNSRPLKDENYENLKAQCYFKLAERINNAGVYLDTSFQPYKETIMQELDAHRRKNIDKDGKLGVIPKEKIKEMIGRSPDFADALMMREYFELKPSGVYAIR